MRKTHRYEISHEDFKLIDTLRDYDLVYVATPFSRYEHGLQAAYEDACAVTGELLRFDVKAFSPIAHTHGISEHANIDPLDHQFWMRVDAPYMDKAAALVVMQLDGWEESVGINIEISRFREAGKPIHFIKPYRNPAYIEVFSLKYGHWFVYAALLFMTGIVLFGR